MDDVLLDKKNGLYQGIEDFFDTLDMQELKPTYTIELFLTHMNEYLNVFVSRKLYERIAE